MTVEVFIAVIAAAALHAVWNALAKGKEDKVVGMAAIVLGRAVFAFPLLFILPAPHPAAWPFVAIGVVLHVGYQIFLVASYRIGDLTQVYPIARGSAPLIVAGVSVVFLGVELGQFEIAAILLIGLGIISLSIVRQGDGLRNWKAGFLAFGTGCFIASYSLNDGTGARLAGHAFGFYSWMTVANGVVVALMLLPSRRDVFPAILRDTKFTATVGAVSSFIAYGLVNWAFTKAPIATVTALRETSIVFALVIGVFFLKERLNLIKVLITAVILSGAALLRLSRNGS